MTAIGYLSPFLAHNSRTGSNAYDATALIIGHLHLQGLQEVALTDEGLEV